MFASADPAGLIRLISIAPKQIPQPPERGGLLPAFAKSAHHAPGQPGKREGLQPDSAGTLQPGNKESLAAGKRSPKVLIVLGLSVI